MSDVELRHLTTMAAVADEGTFGRAAARLGYTQSTVSQQVAAFEKAVGGAVFDRPGGPKPVRITPLGTVVLAHGRDLLSKAQAMAAAVDRFKAGGGRVDIGTFQSVSNVILPLVIRRLRDEHPDCDIRLFEEETDHPHVHELDLMFFDGRVDGEVELLAARRPLPVGGPPRHLSRRSGAAGPTRRRTDGGAPADLRPGPDGAGARTPQRPATHRVRTAGNETVLSMVRAGMGSAVLPQLEIHSGVVDSDESLCVHELEPGSPREIFLLWQAHRTHSPLAARAIEIAVDVASKIAKRT
ncbi:LysR family transcriptional regulator [Micromonospora sp. M12]